MKSLIFAFLALALPGWATCGSGSSTITGLSVTGHTPRQIVVQFTVPHANAAQVDVYSDAACTVEVSDTSGNNAANRSGSVIDGVLSAGSTDGAVVQFAAGDLTDVNALNSGAQYFIQVTNTGDSSKLTLQAGAAPIRAGNLYPEQPLADSTKWDNRTYPRFTWGAANRNKSFIDPTTGLLAKPFSYPGDFNAWELGVSDGVTNITQLGTPVTNTGSWTNPANVSSTFNVLSCAFSGNTCTATVPSGSWGTCTGTCDVWLPLPALNGFTRFDAGGGSVYTLGYNFDFLVPYIWASITSGTPTMTVSLTQTPAGSAYHGCSFSAALSSTATGYRSTDPDPAFANLCTSPVVRGDIATSAGTVTTAGTAVTYATGEYFQANWPAGSYILINGVYYQIASVTNGTSLVLTGSAGTQSSPVSYSSATMGIRIQVTAGAATLSVQAEYRYGVSTPMQVAETIGSGQMLFNQHPNTITTSATGGALGYSLQGYIGFMPIPGPIVAVQGNYYLVIPKDQNGQPDGEVRVLANTYTTRPITSNGASIQPGYGGGLFYVGPDPTNPNLWYVGCYYRAGDSCSTGGTAQLLLSASFDSSIAGCSTLWKTWVGAGDYNAHGNNSENASGTVYDSCITYTNLTNPGTGTPMDLTSQIVRAYAAVNPGFDLTPFSPGQIQYANGWFNDCLSAGGDPYLNVCATFNSSGVLTQVYDTWTTWPGRNCWVHGATDVVGNFHKFSCNFAGGSNPSVPLYGPFQMATTRLNLAGFGSTAWSNTTTLDAGATNQYACPTAAQMIALGTPSTIANYMVSIGSAGSHCIEIEVRTEPCSVNPDPAAIFAGSLTEAQKYPCPTNPAYSMLQTIQPGDQIMDSANGTGGEGFPVLTKQITSPGGVCTTGVGNCIVDLWLTRGTGTWLPQGQPAGNSVHSPYNTLQTHANGWISQVTGLQNHNCMVLLADSTTVTHTWVASGDLFCDSHGIAAPGSTANNQNLMFGDLNTYTTLDVGQNIPLSTAWPAWGKGCEFCVMPSALSYGQNSISLPGGLLQIYTDGLDLANPGPRSAITFRPINGSGGYGAEITGGMGTSGYALTAVGGKTQTYTITDPYSAGAANQKLTPLAGWAGAHLLQDYSGTASALPDSGYGMCRALQANECVTGSSAGTTYVSVPAAAGYTQAFSGQHTRNAPGVVNAPSILGQHEDIPYATGDPIGLHTRLFGQGLTGVGRQWQFSEPKFVPTGDWYLASVPFKDGMIAGIWMFQRPSYLSDSLNRTGYENLPFVVGGSIGDQIRVEFWYQEWLGVNGRAEHAYAPYCAAGSSCASPAAAPPANPFLWSYETANYATCDSGCIVQVPAISGHLLYYRVHRKSPTVELSGPVGIIAVP